MFSAVETDATAILVLPLLPIIIMLLVGVAIVLQVLLSARARTFSLRGLAPTVLASAWLLPIAGVMGYVLLQTAQHFRQPAAPVAAPEDALLVLPASVDGSGQELPPNPPPLNAAVSVAEAEGAGKMAVAHVSTKSNVADDSAAEGESVGMSDEDSQDLSHLPEWLKAAMEASSKPVPAGWNDDSRIVLSSQRFATVEQAKQQVIEQAVERVRTAFHREHPYQGQWELPADLVDAEVVRDRYVEEIEHDFGSFTGRMYRVHLQLDLDSSTAGPIYRSWREQIVERRLWLLGSLVGLMTLVLGTTTAYLRLDTMTQGQYRSRLRLAATLLITAGGFTAAALIPHV